MSSPVVSAATVELVEGVFGAATTRRAPRWIGAACAVAVHAAIVFVGLSQHSISPSNAKPIEIELAEPEPPSPVVPPDPTPPPLPEPEPTPTHAPSPAHAAATAPPAPARAGALVTAKADSTPSPGADEPVDFTNDPSVLGFGAGVVAVGGKAEVGAPRAKLSAAPAGTGTSGSASKPLGDALVSAADLSRKPGLGDGDPCGGYFPSGASDDVATAAVLVTIAKSGAVEGAQLLTESPAGQGFGAAARTCMTRKRFTPGLDRAGNPARTAIRVNVRFTR